VPSVVHMFCQGYTTCMLATNHALTGAVLGALLPLHLAIPAAFASHFVLDALPHYGITGTKRNSSRAYKLIVLSDVAVALTGSIGLAFLHKWQMNLCAWAAWSPDLPWVVYYLRHRSLHITSSHWFLRLHQHIQWGEHPWGIIPELIYFFCLLPFYILQLV
jgi:hypothetical protein